MIYPKLTKSGLMLLVLSFALAVCATPATAITWGENDGTRHPNVGAIIIHHPDWAQGSEFCSGTLIAVRERKDDSVFLTAGHCTDRLAFFISVGLDAYVSFDSTNALDDSTWIPVSQVITHPDYYWGPQSNPHDVGILILGEQMTGITPAVLPAEGFLDQLRADGKLRHRGDAAKFTIVGYGCTLEWPPPVIRPPEYPNNEIPRRMSESEYLNLRKAWLHMSQNHAPGRDNAGSCSGDSGGPAFWTDPDGTETLVAVTSWGDAQCVATGTNYRVDIPETLDFIASVLYDAAPPSPARKPTATWWGRIKSDY